MKKCYFLLAALAVMFGLSHKIVAQSTIGNIKISDNANTYWYYIANAHTETSTGNGIYEGDGRTYTLITSNGNDPEVDVSTNILKNSEELRAFQQWKVMEYQGSYYFVNKATDSKLDFRIIDSEKGIGRYTNSDAEALFSIAPIGEFVMIKRDGTESLLEALNEGYKYGVEDALIKEDFSNVPELVGDKGLVKGSPRAWRFIDATELNALYPILSKEQEAGTWYRIKSPATNKYISLSDDGKTLVCLDKNESDNSQLFAFLADEDAEKVKAIHASGAVIDATKSILSSSSFSGFYLRMVYMPDQDLAFNIRSNRKVEGNGICVNEAGNISSIAVKKGSPNLFDSTDDQDFRWVLEPANATLTIPSFEAQLVAGLQASTAENPIWYYIENGHSSDSDGGGKYINDSDGRFGCLLTAYGNATVSGTEYPLATINPIFISSLRSNQKWRIQFKEERGGNKYYQLITEAGQYLSYTGTPTATPYGYTKDESKATLFQFSNASTSEIYVQLQRDGATNFVGSLNGGGNNHWSLTEAAAVSKVGETGLTSSPRAWRFVPIADLDKVYPVVSDDESGDTWYYLKTFGVDGEASYLTNEDGSSALHPKFDKGDELVGSQLFKLVKGDNNYTLTIINKGLEEAAYLNMDGSNAVFIETAKLNWVIRQNYNPQENEVRFAIREGRNGKLLDAATVPLQTVGFNKAVDGYDCPRAWVFEKQDGSNSIKEINSDQLKVRVENGYITVEGINSPITVCTITGITVDANVQQAPGVYIVKAGKQTAKVLVK